MAKKNVENKVKINIVAILLIIIACFLVFIGYNVSKTQSYQEYSAIKKGNVIEYKLNSDYFIPTLCYEDRVYDLYAIHNPPEIHNENIIGELVGYYRYGVSPTNKGIYALLNYSTDEFIITKSSELNVTLVWREKSTTTKLEENDSLKSIKTVVDNRDVDL